MAEFNVDGRLKVKTFKANFKKGLIFVETTLPDSALAECIADAGFQATLIRDRRGLFG